MYVSSKELQQLRDRIERARAAIARDEQALAAAKVGRELYEAHTLEQHLVNRRAYLAELLEEHAGLALGEIVPE